MLTLVEWFLLDILCYLAKEELSIPMTLAVI